MELVTPPDDSCISIGVTRSSILDMREGIEKKFGVKVVERQISIQEVINAHREGRLFEMFGAAPHCDLLPISRLSYDMTQIQMTPGPFSKELN